MYLELVFELSYHCEVDLDRKIIYIQTHLLLVRLTDSQFADDPVLFAMSCEGAEQSLV